MQVIKCIKNYFNKYSLRSNINFWFFFIILFIFQIYILLNACCKGKEQIFKRLENDNIFIKEKNNAEKNEIKINPLKTKVKKNLKYNGN